MQKVRTWNTIAPLSRQPLAAVFIAQPYPTVSVYWNEAMKLPQHQLLDAVCLETVLNAPLGTTESPTDLLEKLSLPFTGPFQASDDIRKHVRDMLRLSGFKPTGRSKPASEYLLRVAQEGTLGPINLVVDLCNIVSLHSGLPISVIDLDLAQPPLSIQVAEPGANYIFNRSGQTMDIGGLLCLCDAKGPCANGVKDSQRTKTNDQTVRTLSVVWGTNKLTGYTQKVVDWYQQLLLPFGETSLF